MADYNDSILRSPLELKGLSKFFSLVFHRSVERAVLAFCELGIADLMADYQAPITASELSRLNGNDWNAEFLYRLLRVIAAIDIVKKLMPDDENLKKHRHPEETIRFQLTDDGLLLTSNHFSQVRDMIRFELGPNTEKASAYLPFLIKSGYKNGNGCEQAFGCSLFDFMQKENNKEYASIFNNAMVAYSNCITLPAILVSGFARFDKLVDIAGGLGTLLPCILEKCQNLHGILFDLEHVIESAKTINPNEFQRKQIAPNRYDFVAGDMFKSETIPPADAYILKFIIHNWNDEKSIEILKSIRNANKTPLKKTITVFILEMIILSDDKENSQIHVMDLELLVGLSSKERTMDEYISLLDKSGYELKQLYRTNDLLSIIEAVTTTQNCD